MESSQDDSESCPAFYSTGRETHAEILRGLQGGSDVVQDHRVRVGVHEWDDDLVVVAEVVSRGAGPGELSVNDRRNKVGEREERGTAGLPDLQIGDGDGV